VPPEGEGLVLAARGWYARWRWDTIVAWGWHPFLRINVGSKARLPGEETFEWLSRWVPTPGTSWQGKVECFASKKRSGEWDLADATSNPDMSQLGSS